MENNNNDNGLQVLSPTAVSFKRRTRHPLNAVLKQLIKEGPAAVMTLTRIMENKSSDDKSKLAAAKIHLEALTAISQAIERDDVRRLAAQATLAPPSLENNDSEEEGAEFDFDNVQELS